MRITLYNLPKEITEADIPDLMSHVGAYSEAKLITEDGTVAVVAQLSVAHNATIRQGEIEWRQHRVKWHIPTPFAGD